MTKTLGVAQGHCPLCREMFYDHGPYRVHLNDTHGLFDDPGTESRLPELIEVVEEPEPEPQPKKRRRRMLATVAAGAVPSLTTGLEANGDRDDHRDDDRDERPAALPEEPLDLAVEPPVEVPLEAPVDLAAEVEVEEPEPEAVEDEPLESPVAVTAEDEAEAEEAPTVAAESALDDLVADNVMDDWTELEATPLQDFVERARELGSRVRELARSRAAQALLVAAAAVVATFALAMAGAAVWRAVDDSSSEPAVSTEPAPSTTAATASAPAAPAPPVGANQYVVERGDTLSKIAARFGVPVEALVAANGIQTPNLIFRGQVLTIPAPPAGP